MTPQEWGQFFKGVYKEVYGDQTPSELFRGSNIGLAVLGEQIKEGLVALAGAVESSKNSKAGPIYMDANRKQQEKAAEPELFIQKCDECAHNTPGNAVCRGCELIGHKFSRWTPKAPE